MSSTVRLITTFCCCLMLACSRSDTSLPTERPSFKEHGKQGNLSLFIVGDYFHNSFVRELATIAKNLPPEGRRIFLCTDQYKTALTPFFTANGIANSEFVVFDKSAPVLRQWARDVAVTGQQGSRRTLIVSPDKHASTREDAQRVGDILNDILPPSYDVFTAPFVFEGGNCAFVESAGRRHLIIGKKVIFDNTTYQKKSWASGMTNEALLGAIKETFAVDSVIVLGRADTRPAGRLYFEYHIDMGMAILRDSQAVVSKLEFSEDNRTALVEAVRSRHPIVTPFDQVADTDLAGVLNERLNIVSQEYEDYAATLTELGLRVHRSPITWKHVLSSMSWTNVLQVGNSIFMPLYADTLLGRITSTQTNGGYVQTTLDASRVNDEEYSLWGANKENFDLYSSLGYDVIPVPEYLHYFMGGIHCFVNVIE